MYKTVPRPISKFDTHRQARFRTFKTKMAASNAKQSISTIGACEQAFKGFTIWGKGTTILTGKYGTVNSLHLSFYSQISSLLVSVHSFIHSFVFSPNFIFNKALEIIKTCYVLLFKLVRNIETIPNPHIRRLQKQPIKILVSKFSQKTTPIFRALATSIATSMF